MEKSRDAFRTISEVAEWLDVPTHVLRFWESRFSQIKPVKRAGGRRYYRPSDMRVIGGVKTLLHDQGMTIRGVQKLFREKGIKHISGHAPALHGEDDSGTVTETVVVDHVTNKPAAPAPAARSTRDAAPDPIIDPAEPAAESGNEDLSELTVELDEDVEALIEEAPEAEPVLQFTRSAPAPAEPSEPTPTPAPTPPAPLEVSADVPLSDPSDDDADHPAAAGVVARLRVTPRASLSAHKDVLSAAVDKLKALNARTN